MSTSPPPPEQDPVAAGLGELAEKYGLLCALAAGRPGRTDERRASMREVAARFPGALREWERATPAQLERRRASVEAALAHRRAGIAAAGATTPSPATAPDDAAIEALPDWMRVSLRFHRVLRGALAAKRFFAGRPIDDERLAEAERAFRLDRCQLRAIAHPSDGRLRPQVVAEVATWSGLDVPTVEALLDAASDMGSPGEPLGGSASRPVAAPVGPGFAAGPAAPPLPPNESPRP